jgi:type VI secretion system protein ImpH
MADNEGLQADPLTKAKALVDSWRGTACRGFDFFRLVRLIQAARSDLKPIGLSKTPADDPLRFCQHPSLAFAPSTLDELVIDDADPAGAPRLYVNFMGLFGPNGPLPLHLTEYAIRRELGQRATEGAATTASTLPGGTLPSNTPAARGQRDFAMSHFFDVFHHRLISLFFRAWAVCQPAVDLDRKQLQRFLFFLGAFIGESNVDLMEVSKAGEDVIPIRAKVFYSGWLASTSRSAEGLRAILQDYFEVPVEIREFWGRWFALPPEDRCKIGDSAATGTLGQNVIVGTATWAVNLAYRIRMGPMNFARFSNLLPSEPGFAQLRGWIVNYSGAELLWDAQLVLLAGEVPDVQLGRSGKLGWTTWLKSNPFTNDVGDLIVAAA